jgi:molecular chaperone HtpG
LYSNQVFITDSVEEIVPEFLTLLHGVIDSPDIPLNVSRSYLQSDSNVKKISSHITKKVADKLAEMFQKDRKDFEEKWNDLYLFVQYGMLSDEKFAEKAKSFALVKNTEGSFFTMEEYLEKIKALQTNKSEEQIVLYTSDAEGQFSYVKQAKDRGYDVLVLDGPLASHWIQKLEQQQEKVRFSRVDSDSLDKLIDKGEEIPSKLSKAEEEKLKPLFEEAVNKEKYTVQLESMPESEAPILITQPEFIRRMMEQQRMGGGGFYGAFPEMYQLVINENHPVMSKLLKMKSPRHKETVKQLVDLAMLSQGLLKGEALTDFIHRSVNGMVES